MKGTVWINVMFQFAIIIIMLFIIDRIAAEKIPEAYNCGEGYTADTTNGNCYLNTDSSITKSIPSAIGDFLRIMKSLLPVVGMILLLESIYRGLRKSGMI